MTRTHWLSEAFYKKKHSVHSHSPLLCSVYASWWFRRRSLFLGCRHLMRNVVTVWNPISFYHKKYLCKSTTYLDGEAIKIHRKFGCYLGYRFFIVTSLSCDQMLLPLHFEQNWLWICMYLLSKTYIIRMTSHDRNCVRKHRYLDYLFNTVFSLA